MIGAKRLVALFDLNMDLVVTHEQKNRWVNVIRALALEEEKDVEKEFIKVLEAFPNKPRLYYLEAVRRNLMVSKNEESKRAPMIPLLKDIMREALK